MTDTALLKTIPTEAIMDELRERVEEKTTALVAGIETLGVGDGAERECIGVDDDQPCANVAVATMTFRLSGGNAFFGPPRLDVHTCPLHTATALAVGQKWRESNGEATT